MRHKKGRYSLRDALKFAHGLCLCVMCLTRIVIDTPFNKYTNHMFKRLTRGNKWINEAAVRMRMPGGGHKTPALAFGKLLKALVLTEQDPNTVNEAFVQLVSAYIQPEDDGTDTDIAESEDEEGKGKDEDESEEEVEEEKKEEKHDGSEDEVEEPPQKKQRIDADEVVSKAKKLIEDLGDGADDEARNLYAAVQLEATKCALASLRSDLIAQKNSA